MNAEANLANDDRIDERFRFVIPKPVQNPWLWLRFGRFAQDICVDEYFTIRRLIRRDIGTKYPLTGQAKSHSNTTIFTAPLRRWKRYSPRSIRSTSNCWPDLCHLSAVSPPAKLSGLCSIPLLSCHVRYHLTFTSVKLHQFALGTLTAIMNRNAL